MSTINTSNPLTASGATGSTPSRFSEMSTEDFVRIIFTELSNQDPFKPNDSAALLQQLNSIRSIESDMKLGEQLEKLVTENQLAAASGMIGKFVGGLTEDNTRVAGFVVSAIRQGDDIALELDNGWFVPINNVETVIDPSLLPEAPESPAPAPQPTPESNAAETVTG
jgi:flagellar basal-body rod modification protein FlgD